MAKNKIKRNQKQVSKVSKNLNNNKNVWKAKKDVWKAKKALKKTHKQIKKAKAKV